MLVSIDSIVNTLLLPRGKESDLLFREITKQQVLSLLAVLVRRQVNKTKIYPPSLIQTVKCVSLKKVPSNLCSDLNNGFVLETDKLPRPLVLDKNQPFISVSTSYRDAKRINISYIAPEQLEFLKYRKFTSKIVHYTYENNRIVIINNLDLKDISIRNLWDNPSEVVTFSRQQAVACNCCESIDDEECDDNQESDCYKDGTFYIDNTFAGLILSMYDGNNNNKDTDV